MDQREGMSLNDFFVNNLACLSHMFAQIEEEAKRERQQQLASDWKEWNELDSQSQQFILDYLDHS